MLNDPEVAKWTVLIVDDEPDNRGVAEKVLSFFGAKVHTATNGQEGLDLLKTIKPTVILLDLSMPKMDGWEMLKQVRATPDTASLPVIALTAHAMAGDKDRVIQAGFNDYISKPFRLESFLKDIKQCLGKLPSAGLTPVAAKPPAPPPAVPKPSLAPLAIPPTSTATPPATASTGA